MSVLVTEGIGMSFGGVVALEGVGFSAAPGGVISIIGPNGAVKLMSGFSTYETGLGLVG